MEDNSINSEKNYNKESMNFPASFINPLRNSKKKLKNINNEINNKQSFETFEDFILKMNNEENYGNSIINNENFQEDNQSLKLVNNPFFNKNFEIRSEKQEKKKKIAGLGRKKKDSLEKGIHNKYTSDNLIRKCKAVMINIIGNFINKKIFEIYRNEFAYTKKRKRLMKMNQFQIVNSNIKFNQTFLNKTLNEIFSEKLSSRCTTFNKDHNKKLIQELINDKDEIKRRYFNDLFSLTFLDCIRHLRGSRTIKILEDLQDYDEVCQNLNGDDDYKETFRCYIDNYEDILDKKRARKPQKNRRNGKGNSKH